tara:strand:+ start:852 stop:4607 length:3756 start_codon:yes stop_codon:yes gene_type:complete
MATQIKVNSSTGNITVQLSRGVIGPSTTANVANTAYNLDAATTANVVIGGGVNGYVLSTDGAGVTSWVAQTGGGGSAPGGANTQIQYNDAGTLEGDATFSFNNTTDVVSASHFSGEAGNLSNIQGANVSGAVANASHAVISDSANLVAVANVTGIGNIATVNLDGNAANFLDGTGSFGPAGAGSQTLAQVLTTGNLSSGTGITMSTTDKISFNDAQVNVHSSTDGTLNADADVEIQLQAPYIDLAAANVNMDGNLVITGMFTGDAGGASNVVGANISGAVANATHATVADSANAVAGANVTGEVAFAATANAVALANVAGAGNIASINLDGNVANVLAGDGTFIAAGGAGGVQAEIANGTSNVNIATSDGNVTVGVGGTADVLTVKTTGANIKTSLFVDGTSGNVLIEPNVAFNSRTYSSLIRGEYNTGTGNSTTDQAFITDNYTTQGLTTLKTFANTAAGQTAEGPSLSFNNYAAIGNTSTDPLVAGQLSLSANPDAANLANATTGTITSIQMGGPGSDGFLTTVGASATDAFGEAAWKQFQYRPRAMEFYRRGGDADAREGVVANDETSLNFYMASNNAGGGSSWESYPAVIAGKADPAFSGADNAVVPTGLEFQVTTAAFDRFNHTMYANGDVVFNSSAESYNPSGPNEPVTVHGNGLVTANAFTASTGNITATAGQFVGDGGGLSNISVAAGTSIVNGTSNVSVALDGNVTAGIGGTADMLVLSTDGANVKNKVFIDNADGNVLLDPNVAFNSDTFTNITRGEYDSGASLSSLNTAIVTDNYAGTGEFSQIMYANTAAGQIAQGPKITLEDKSTIGNTNTDPFVHSSVSFSAAAPTSNLAAASTATHSTVTLDGSLTIDTGSNLQTTGSEYQTATIQQYQYQNRGVEFYRRGGNAASTAGVAANDEVAIISHMASAAGGVAFNSYSGKIAFKVDSAWVDPGNFSQGVPQGIEFGVTDTNYAQLYHNMYANGTVAFNSAGPGTTVTIGSNGVITGDGGGLSNVSATATPAGFADSVQFNDGGTALGGDSVFTYSSSAKQLSLAGAAAGVGGVPTLNITNGGITVSQEEIGGGAATFAFNNYYAGGLIAPSTHFRARGTQSAPTQVASGDQIVSEGYYVNSGTGHTYVGVGGQTATVQSNDGLGNVAVTYSFATAKPANGPNSNDKILFDTEFTQFAGNIQMNNTSASFTAGRIKQITDTFSNLTASPVTGERAMITDGPTFNFGAVVGSGGGTQVMPVFWDGSDWRQG